jgi:hypothetical protein
MGLCLLDRPVKPGDDEIGAFAHHDYGSGLAGIGTNAGSASTGASHARTDG